MNNKWLYYWTNQITQPGTFLPSNIVHRRNTCTRRSCATSPAHAMNGYEMLAYVRECISFVRWRRRRVFLSNFPVYFYMLSYSRARSDAPASALVLSNREPHRAGALIKLYEIVAAYLKGTEFFTVRKRVQEGWGGQREGNAGRTVNVSGSAHCKAQWCRLFVVVLRFRRWFCARFYNYTCALCVGRECTELTDSVLGSYRPFMT